MYVYAPCACLSEEGVRSPGIGVSCYHMGGSWEQPWRTVSAFICWAHQVLIFLSTFVCLYESIPQKHHIRWHQISWSWSYRFGATQYGENWTMKEQQALLVIWLSPAPLIFISRTAGIHYSPMKPLMLCSGSKYTQDLLLAVAVFSWRQVKNPNSSFSHFPGITSKLMVWEVFQRRRQLCLSRGQFLHFALWGR